MDKDGIISVISFTAITNILGMSVKEAIDKNLNIKQKEDKMAIAQATKKSKKVTFISIESNPWSGNENRMGLEELLDDSETWRWSIRKCVLSKGLCFQETLCFEVCQSPTSFRRKN